MVGDAGLEYIERATDIDLEGRPRIVVAVEQPKGGQVEHPVHPFHRRVQNVGLHDVAPEFEDPDARVSERVGEILPGAAAEIVIDQNLADLGLDQLVNQVRADEPGAPDHQHPFAAQFHRQLLRIIPSPEPAPRRVPTTFGRPPGSG